MLRISQRKLPKYKIGRKIDKSDPEKLIEEMRGRVKKDPVVIAKFKEYSVSLDEIDTVHVEFADLDVSAKTKDKKIYINQSMLKPDSSVSIEGIFAYFVHELTHYLQQSSHKSIDDSANVDYIDKPTENEAFKVQVDYKKENEGEGVAEKYVDDLMDYHDVDRKKRKKKKKEMLE